MIHNKIKNSESFHKLVRKRSKETAEVLSSWIRQVIQTAETWISSDIEKGARWNEQINKELEETKVGIICLNKENLTSEWILFESGALSKTSDAYVCTFLLDVNPADIKPPLGQFQHTLFTKEDIRKLIQTINNKILSTNEKSLNDKDLDEVFDTFWPKIEGRLNDIKNLQPDTQNHRRSDREILEEILQVVRANYQPSTLTAYEPIINALGSVDYSKQDLSDLYETYFLKNYLSHSRNPDSDVIKRLLEVIRRWKYELKNKDAPGDEVEPPSK